MFQILIVGERSRPTLIAILILAFHSAPCYVQRLFFGTALDCLTEIPHPLLPNRVCLQPRKIMSFQFCLRQHVGGVSVLSRRYDKENHFLFCLFPSRSFRLSSHYFGLHWSITCPCVPLNHIHKFLDGCRIVCSLKSKLIGESFCFLIAKQYSHQTSSGFVRIGDRVNSTRSFVGLVRIFDFSDNVAQRKGVEGCGVGWLQKYEAHTSTNHSVSRNLFGTNNIMSKQ